MEHDIEKWQSTLNSIKQLVSQEKYATWFEPIVFLGVNDNTVNLGVPNKFFYQYLSGNFGQLIISEVLKHFNTKDINVKWDMNEQAGSQQPQISPAPATPKAFFDTHLCSEYTFDNFVMGETNKLARHLALSIATKPLQTAFNPFFIHGDSGVGKSHLVNAIGLKMLEHNPDKRVLYISAHDFLLQYTDSISKKKFNDFMYFYQSVECLIIDDIHEISGKPRTQEALFNIFNHLQRNGRQIIFTCDKAPSQLEGFEERVISRFFGGAIAELQRPDEQLRIDILKAKTSKNQINIPDNVINYIALNATGNVRDLEGIINSLLARSIVENCEIDLHMAQYIVNKYVRTSAKTITIDVILRSTCKYYKVTQRDINSNSRKSPIVRARQVAMYFANKHTELSSTQIGISIGRRDHSTVLHAINQVTRKLKTDSSFKAELLSIEQDIIK